MVTSLNPKPNIPGNQQTPDPPTHTHFPSPPPSPNRSDCNPMLTAFLTRFDPFLRLFAPFKKQRGACVVALLVLTKHPVLGCSEARPPRGPPYKNNKHAAFVAAPTPRATRCDGGGARSSSHERVSRRFRRHQQQPNNHNNGRETRSTGPSFFAGRDSRSYREEGSAGALTRLSVSASLTDIREKRRTSRPLPPPGAGGRGGGGGGIAGAPDLSAAPVEVSH